MLARTFVLDVKSEVRGVHFNSQERLALQEIKPMLDISTIRMRMMILKTSSVDRRQLEFPSGDE
jgi:hypothetical protein